MNNEPKTLVANELEDAELMDLGNVSELTEGQPNGQAELNSASLA